MCSKRHCIRRPEAWEGDDRKDDGGDPQGSPFSFGSGIWILWRGLPKSVIFERGTAFRPLAPTLLPATASARFTPRVRRSRKHGGEPPRWRRHMGCWRTSQSRRCRAGVPGPAKKVSPPWLAGFRSRRRLHCRPPCTSEASSGRPAGHSRLIPMAGLTSQRNSWFVGGRSVECGGESLWGQARGVPRGRETKRPGGGTSPGR
jgi:hypothetical protein